MKMAPPNPNLPTQLDQAAAREIAEIHARRGSRSPLDRARSRSRAARASAGALRDGEGRLRAVKMAERDPRSRLPDYAPGARRGPLWIPPPPDVRCTCTRSTRYCDASGREMQWVELDPDCPRHRMVLDPRLRAELVDGPQMLVAGVDVAEGRLEFEIHSWDEEEIAIHSWDEEDRSSPARS